MIPLLDGAALRAAPEAFAAELGAACRETGFFLLKNPGLAPDLRARAFAEAAAFFARPQAEKDALSILRSAHNRGYAAKGSEALDPSGAVRDRKEAFNIGLDLAADDPRVRAGERFRGVNLWPEGGAFRAVMLEYFEAMTALGGDLLSAVARDLGLDPGFFAPHVDAPLSTLRILSYPAASGAAGEIGAGAHTDYGALTLLATDGTPGLQIRPRGGDWIDAPVVEGVYVVNIGDCLMRWTNDVYVSTPHRVLPPPRPRLSIAFFLDPNPDAVVAALPGTGEAKYPPTTGADYLESRLRATYAMRES